MKLPLAALTAIGLFVALAALALVVLFAMLDPFPAHASPAYCYSTGEFLPFYPNSGYCPDGEAPFNGPGPSYGGQHHRSTDSSDD